MVDETFAVLHMFHSFARGEIDLVYVHGIGIHGWLGSSNSLSQQYEAIPSTLEFPKSYHISVEFSCFVKPLFPFPASLFLSIGEGSRSHHDSKLVCYSLLKSIYKDAVKVDSAACLSQFKSGGIFIEVPVELVHIERIDSLARLVHDILWDEGFFKGAA